jgi:hypothetical protein
VRAPWRLHRYRFDTGNALIVLTAVPDRDRPKNTLGSDKNSDAKLSSSNQKSDTFFLFSAKFGYSLNLSGRVCAVITSAHVQGCPDLISPSVFVAVLQTLFAALLSLSSFGDPGSTHGRGQGLAVREAAARPFTLSDRAIALNEEADRPDPRQSGGNALPPAELARAANPTPSRLSPIQLAVLAFAERSVRAHPATGPPAA